MGRIVVGVDGSDGSRRALRWAADEALLRGGSLEVIHTYEQPSSWGAYGYSESMSAAQVESVRAAIEVAEQEAAAHAQALVEQMVADLDDRLSVEARALEGHRPAQLLVEQSADADLLVVGSRGRGGFASLMLGSVSQQCATHASCPVVIIPTPRSEKA